MSDAFNIAWRFNIQKLDDLLIEKLTGETDDTHLTFEVLNKLNMAIKRKFSGDLTPERQEEKNQLYEKICKNVVK